MKKTRCSNPTPVTSDEAKERMKCPFTLAPGSHPSRCLGDDCMAWRFHSHDNDEGFCKRIGE